MGLLFRWFVARSRRKSPVYDGDNVNLGTFSSNTIAAARYGLLRVKF
jgi:hypothetical protein